MKDHLAGSTPNLVSGTKETTYLPLDFIPVEMQVVLTPGRWLRRQSRFESDKPIITLITEHCGANALAS